MMTTVQTALAVVLLLTGAAFMVVATVGLLRLPDLYTRMHAITKAGTLGVGCMLAAVAVTFADLSVTTRAVAVIVFVLVTAPVAGHMIGRAAYMADVPLWQGTVLDQWRGHHSRESEAVSASEQGEADVASSRPD
jgi:multicomponent Na+:H+ antiporter subunit G